MIDSGTSLPFYSVWGSGNGDVWAVGAAGTVRRFTRQNDGKVAVQEVAFPSRATLRALVGFSADDIWVAEARERWHTGMERCGRSSTSAQMQAPTMGHEAGVGTSSHSGLRAPETSGPLDETRCFTRVAPFFRERRHEEPYPCRSPRCARRRVVPLRC